MEKIYSTLNSKNLLHIIYRREDIKSRRENFASEKEVLQVAAILLNKDEVIAAHKHLENIKKIDATQEFILVIEGELEVNFYDTNDLLIKTTVLHGGDCFTTYRGGHSIKALKENTKLYEIKNGPYIGKDKDKVFIK